MSISIKEKDPSSVSSLSELLTLPLTYIILSIFKYPMIGPGHQQWTPLAFAFAGALDGAMLNQLIVGDNPNRGRTAS